MYSNKLRWNIRQRPLITSSYRWKRGRRRLKMPIKPENKSRYPKNWKEIRERILKRANNRCEFCGVENHTYRYNPKTGKDAYIVLTIAHLDHTPENCSDDNLKALCQRCHNQYDAEHRKQTRKGNSAEKQ